MKVYFDFLFNHGYINVGAVIKGTCQMNKTHNQATLRGEIMKLKTTLITLLFATLSSTALAEGYVGAGSGGPLMSTNGCVMSSNGQMFPECGGQAKAPVAPQPPKQVVRVITDCNKCRQMKKK